MQRALALIELAHMDVHLSYLQDHQLEGNQSQGSTVSILPQGKTRWPPFLLSWQIPKAVQLERP